MTASQMDTGPADINFLKHEFNRFRADLAAMKAKLGANPAEALEHFNAYLHSEDVAARLAALEHQLEGFGGKAKGAGKDAVSRLEKEVTERPVTSVAIAFGIGLLAANLLRHR
ncbi:hypothetical protein [Acidocella sp.]|uniref:hypothetical protein n=1 Tax=Acidocella sp. TaxID=50710 RepID=UPI0017D1F615|nr:hypothetical protein [Acidocella sp.]NNM56182.1 hypothetical protein [Acidocella sp.]